MTAGVAAAFIIVGAGSATAGEAAVVGDLRSPPTGVAATEAAAFEVKGL